VGENFISAENSWGPIRGRLIYLRLTLYWGSSYKIFLPRENFLLLFLFVHMATFSLAVKVLDYIQISLHKKIKRIHKKNIDIINYYRCVNKLIMAAYYRALMERKLSIFSSS